MEKSLATLTSSLLARKGQARPAMRSAGIGGFAAHPQALDDLGWNDMGLADAAPAPVVPLPVTPLAEPVRSQPAADAPIPTVLVEREALEATLTVPQPVRAVSTATAARLRRETAHAGKAAFTLRVEADRHLRLRLASAITNRSAQDLVTEALDALLTAVPEVDALVAQLPRAATKKTSARAR